MNMHRDQLRWLAIAVLVCVVSLSLAGNVSAHKHSVTTEDDEIVYIAHKQNHPGFVDQGDGTIASCEGIAESEDVGPAGYGLERAHHGPDLEPGKGDGCYTTYGPAPPADTNPAIN
jgi:hypothetical protein